MRNSGAVVSGQRLSRWFQRAIRAQSQKPARLLAWLLEYAERLESRIEELEAGEIK